MNSHELEEWNRLINQAKTSTNAPPIDIVTVAPVVEENEDRVSGKFEFYIIFCGKNSWTLKFWNFSTMLRNSACTDFSEFFSESLEIDEFLKFIEPVFITLLSILII